MGVKRGSGAADTVLYALHWDWGGEKGFCRKPEESLVSEKPRVSVKIFSSSRSVNGSDSLSLE